MRGETQVRPKGTVLEGSYAVHRSTTTARADPTCGGAYTRNFPPVPAVAARLCLSNVAPQEHDEPMECFDRFKRCYAALIATERGCRTELNTST
jgi:hypothetical protein